MSGITISDGLIVFATLLGPILAVQAQKWIERSREVGKRRESVFTTLMATRSARGSVDHVRALNQIQIAFYDGGRVLRNRKCQAVLDAWREYWDHLNTDISQYDEAQHTIHGAQILELFANLLGSLAAERGYDFDRVDLKKGGYHPNSMANAEQLGNAIMVNALSVLTGNKAMRINLEQPPAEPAATTQNIGNT